MTRAAAQNVELHASSLAVGRGIPLAEATVDFANVIHAQCIVPSVRTAVVRRKCLFSHEKTDPSIAVIATKRNVLVAQMTDDRAGSLHDKDCSDAG